LESLFDPPSTPPDFIEIGYLKVSYDTFIDQQNMTLTLVTSVTHNTSVTLNLCHTVSQCDTMTQNSSKLLEKMQKITKKLLIKKKN
jgi:hypothetical protein